jgi:hypothetical protein
MFKMFSGSSPIFALSNHMTIFQTQTCTTVPLRNYFSCFLFCRRARRLSLTDPGCVSNIEKYKDYYAVHTSIIL